MASRPEVCFREALSFAIGGGWGQEEATAKESERVRVIRGTDIPSVNARYFREIPTRYETPSKVEKRRLLSGDIVLEISGGSSSKGQPTGRTVFIDDEVLDGLGGTAIPASFCRLVRVDAQRVLPKFAYYWLQEMYVSGRAFSYESQSTGISNFQFERFLDAERLVLPSMSMQEEIAAALSPIEARQRLLRQTNANLEAIAKTLFKSWFIDFDPVRAKAEGREPEGMDPATAALFPSEFEESPLGFIPKGWRPGKFGDLAELAKGSVNPLATPNEEFEHYSLPAFDTGQLPVVERGEAIKSNKTRVPSGAVLQSKLNPHIPRVWLPSRIGERAVCSTEFLPWLPKHPASSELVYCMLTAPSFAMSVRTLATGTSNSHQRVKPDQVAALELVVAPEPIVDAFTRVAHPLLRKVGENRLLAKDLAELRDTLLPRLISGKLRLPDADREIEATA